MFVIVYQHGLGTDVFCTRTKNDARIYICELITEWVNDLFDAEAELEIVNLIANKDWDAARKLYEKKSGESFQIIESEMLVIDADQVVAFAKQYAQKLEKELQEIQKQEVGLMVDDEIILLKEEQE